jgi:hypothetical protein
MGSFAKQGGNHRAFEDFRWLSGWELAGTGRGARGEKREMQDRAQKKLNIEVEGATWLLIVVTLSKINYVSWDSLFEKG